MPQLFPPKGESAGKLLSLVRPSRLASQSSSPGQTLHSLLITDQPLVALGISQILAAIDTRMRVSMVASAQELFNALEEISAVPALVVVDIATRGLAVEQLFIELPKHIGRVPLVALLDDADEVSVRALASAGATCVLKADSADALQAAVVRALTSRSPSAQPASMDSQG